MYKKNKKGSKKVASKRMLWISLLVVLAVIAAVIVLDATNTVSFPWSSSPSDSSSNTPAPQANGTNASNTPAATNTQTQKSSTDNNGVNHGTATDNSGQTGQITTPSSEWTTSSSGLVTIQYPVAQTTLKSGSILYGTSKLSSVSFRVVDDSVGVIAQGSLKVVNGKYSGTLSFQPHASTGHVDVFTQAANGAESNETRVMVKF